MALFLSEDQGVAEGQVNVPEHERELVIDTKFLCALREKLIFDAAHTPFGRIDDFDLNSLMGLTLQQALIQYPKLTEIMDDVLAKVSVTISGTVTSLQRGEAIPKERTEDTREFAKMMKKFGRWLYSRGQFDRALKAFNAALQIFNDDADVIAAMGDIYYGEDKLAEAHEHYKYALKLLPAHPVLLRKLADINVKMAGDFAETVEAEEVFYKEALQYIPGYMPALCGLGDLTLDEGRYEDAQNYFEKAMAADPSCADALVGLARTRLAQGDTETSSLLYEELVTKNPLYVRGLYHMANFQFRTLKNIGRADYYLERAVKVQPGNVKVRFLRAEIALKMNHYDAAEIELQSVLRLDPNNKEAFELYCRLQNGEYFLPAGEDNSSSSTSALRGVNPGRRENSRDFYFSLGHRVDPMDKESEQLYLRQVKSDQEANPEMHKSRSGGKSTLN